MDEIKPIELTRGKTKIIWAIGNDQIIMEMLNNLSAGDGARQKALNVARAKNIQNAILMNYLKNKGIKTAYIKKISPTETICDRVEMIPLECVVRGVPYGSYLLRNHDYVEGFDEKGKPILSKEFKDEEGRPYVFEEPIFEIFHKKTVVSPELVNKTPDLVEKYGKVTKPILISEDIAHKYFCKNEKWEKGAFTDPYIKTNGNNFEFYNQKAPIEGQPLLTRPSCLNEEHLKEIEEMSIKSFKLLSKFLSGIEVKGKPIFLADIKFEFGLNKFGELVLADVVDNDSWRIWIDRDPINGTLDKQLFRDQKVSDNVVVEKYEFVTELLENRFNQYINEKILKLQVKEQIEGLKIKKANETKDVGQEKE